MSVGERQALKNSMKADLKVEKEKVKQEDPNNKAGPTLYTGKKEQDFKNLVKNEKKVI